jgi:glycosyltransferase involved in cell wall biosynthesis
MASALPQRISIVVPVHNEAASLPVLHGEIAAAFAALPQHAWEVLFIDDASTDDSLAVIRSLVAADPAHVGVIALRRNFGQTAAMAAGFDACTGDVVIPMDGDLQNDPADIPRLLEKMAEGYDLVSGWRARRQDDYLSRVLPSRVANALISWITGVHLHDYGCTMKAYHRDVVRHITFYGEMHRLLPALASWAGATIAEIEVNHRPRVHGRSKYGLGRTFSVVLDVLTVKFLLDYATKPMRVFGGLGLLLVALGSVSGAVSFFQKVLPPHQDVTSSPWMFIAIFLFLGGTQFISLGLLGEINIRTYFESQHKPIYTVKEKSLPASPAPREP